ncbi:MAG: hypothetical protein IJL85_01380 [Erysipelotrichaceae bacterium]|nr:hypothetical protein [Erysipelotrichaceae bacterium]
MFKRLLLVATLLLGVSGIWNGYYQTTEVTFVGIHETCYGTLLSKKSESGTWSYQLELDLNAPEEAMNFFKEYRDADHFFYLNYFQDVTDGLLYWPYYPPEEFKILLYFPDTGEIIVSDPLSRYSLSSPFKAVISNDLMRVERNYDYFKMTRITFYRAVILTIAAVITAVLYAQPYNNEIRYMILGNFIYQAILNTLIAFYSFKNGFSYVEYILIMWLPYLLWFLLQGYLLSRHARGVSMPYLCSFFSNAVAYFAGLLLVDVLPFLYTIQ